ncbi:MAG: glutathione S-transferase family protein [Ectothiorhodospiraceae bacterium]|nr:glutathione S-transferase family protein [Ectothiorhodospiraceae bacterium]
MLTIHHAPGTRGFRVIWLCEELGHPYRVEKVDFSAAYRASPEWRRMNPVGKVPVMVDGEVTIFESGAMVQHILDHHGHGRLQPPRDDPGHALFLQWCWFAEATFGRATGELANHKRAFAGALKDDVMAEMRDRARSCLAALDQALATRTYLVGETFTAADVMMGYTLQSFDRHVGDPHPAHVAAWWQRVSARGAYRRALDIDRGL